jgi:AP2-associated kinase
MWSRRYLYHFIFVLVGGFAHVYLVRTPTPVYNTTHHVLKRIAVASEAMLTEVKKEVDIMVRRHFRSLDVADGTFEVFILMEFCPGESPTSCRYQCRF